jgi:hypothetical protein
MALQLKVTIDNKVIEKILLNARKTIDGNIIVHDHPEVDIFVLTAKSKVVCLPKEQLDDEVYDTQNRLFKFLTKKGVIDFTTIQAGNLFMSMEATIPQSDQGDSVQQVLYAISLFTEEEQPFYDNMKEFEKEMESQLLQPEPDEFTEFDPDKYHSDVKGSLPPRFARWGISNIYRI